MVGWTRRIRAIRVVRVFGMIRMFGTSVSTTSVFIPPGSLTLLTHRLSLLSLRDAAVRTPR